MHAWKRTEDVTHRSRGRTEDLRLVACVRADTTDLSISCAAQMVEIDSSKEEGSSTSAGTKLFRSSIVMFESGVGVGVGVGRAGVDLKSGNGDA